MANAVATGSGGAKEKEKRASDKDVDVSNANRGVWLVKVPKYIADRWESVNEGSQVGKLRMVKRPGAKTVISFSLTDSVVAARPDLDQSDGGTKKEIPKEHTFVVSTVQSQTLLLLSHTAGDPEAAVPVPDKLAMEGKVTQRAECRPNSNKVYMNLKREAILKAIEPAKKTLHLDRPVNNYKPVANHAANKEYEARKKAEGKKSRGDRDRVMEILFGLFEKHQYYNIKDLVKETRQPVTYLKEILEEVCIYNRKNPHKSMWELKPEYRHYNKPEAKMDVEESSDDD
jgi:transcription initiation factor TFIIF subunit beta